MTADYDLSKLETSQADLWIFLQADAICAEILARQLNRLDVAKAGPHHAESRGSKVLVSTSQMIGISENPEEWKAWKN